jgi:magnesium transporter
MALHDAAEEVEEAVFSPNRSRPTERIYLLSRQALLLRRAMVPLSEMLDRLATESPTPAGDRLRRRYHDQRTHLAHQVEAANDLGNLLANVLAANQTEVSVRQNDMRRISAWGAIWAIPTLLAGIYGMNFRRLPSWTGRSATRWCWW